MITVYVDVTNLVQARFLTGIQRVTFEVIQRLARYRDEMQLKLVTEHVESRDFWELDTDAVILAYKKREPLSEEAIRVRRLSLEDMAASENPVFFDLDAVWSCMYIRTRLYPELKKRNIRIITHVYDVIVISHPQFTSIDNIVRFPPYIAAAIAYADHIIVNTDNTRKELRKIAETYGLRSDFSCAVIPLGADFAGSGIDENKVHRDARKIAEAGPFVLTVSTIEPRKNHALLLDAFDAGVRELGIQMVFAGKTGWNVSELMKRIHSHPYYQKSLFHLEGMNDDTIRYLYRHAMMVLFPTHIEGFGLSTIEAIQQGTPVACSDIPVMREVGKEYCDYFDLHSSDDVVKILRHYKEHPGEYAKRKELLKQYRTFTWNDMVKEVADVIVQEGGSAEEEAPRIRQMMMLTSRSDSFLGSVPFVEALMPFIEEMVVFCPRKTGDEILSAYHGRLKIRCVHDEELLQGRPLPQDHQTRNFCLRALAIQSDFMDEYFIMSDDDYRPLTRVDSTYFYSGGKMNAYYFHDLDLYCRNIPVSTSFDEGMHRLNRFLNERNLPNLCYASHMPQIIRKTWFREMLEKYPELMELGACEWSTYFNIESHLHPRSFHVQPCHTLMWPGDVTNWARFVKPETYVFENHYPEAYAPGGLLEGCAQEVEGGEHRDAQEKIRRYREMWGGRQERCEEIFEDYCRDYCVRFGARPQLMFDWNDGGKFAKLESIRAGENAAVRMKVEIMEPVYEFLRRTGKTVDIGWNYGTEKKLYNRSRIIDDEHPIVFTFLIPPAGTITAIHLGYELDGGSYHECVSIPLMIE